MDQKRIKKIKKIFNLKKESLNKIKISKDPGPIEPEKIQLPLDINSKEQKHSQKDEPIKNEEQILLTHASLCITNQCNLKCSYCYKPKGNKLYMGEAIGKKSLDFLFKNSQYRLSINFFGGEPLLAFSDIKNIILYAMSMAQLSGKKMSFSISTNGTEINRSIMLFLRRYHVGIILSIDGKPISHNYHRKRIDGLGSFEMIEDKIPLLLEVPEQVHVRMTVTPDTLENMFENVLFIYKTGFRSLAIAIDRTDDRWNKSLMEIFKKEYEKVTKWYVDIIRNNKNFYMVDLDFGVVSLQYPLPKDKISCAAGLKGVAISCNGKIYPCYRFIDFEGTEIGDIFNGIDKEKQKNFVNNSFCENTKCQNCLINFRCHRCSWLSYVKTDHFNLPLNINCLEGKVMLEIFKSLEETLEKEKSLAYLKRKKNIENKFFRYHKS